jgi:transcription-repair coupling factor (superfamily II helicase)
VGAAPSLNSLVDVAARTAARAGPLTLTGLRGAARAVVGARLVQAHGPRPVLFLAAGAKEADALLEDLRSALGEPAAEAGGRVRPFPRHDTPPFDRFSPQPFVTAQRMDLLYRWLVAQGGLGGDPAPVAVAPWTALSALVPSRETVRRRTLELRVGATVERDRLAATLVAAGYSRQPVVEERGEFAVRGGIVDFFPPQRGRPVRVELLGDEVESIREFDAASQRSETPLERVVAAPSREVLLDRDLVVERSEALRSLAAQQRLAPRAVDELVDGLLRGHLPPGGEALAPLLEPALESIFDFLPEDALLVLDEAAPGVERLRRYEAEMLEGFEGAREAGRLVCAPDALYLPAARVEAEVEVRRPVAMERLELDAAGRGERYTVRAFANDGLRTALRQSRSESRPLAPLVAEIRRLEGEGLRVVLAAPSLSGADRLQHLLVEYGVATRLERAAAPCWEWAAGGGREVRVAALSAGFVLPLEGLAVLTEEEVFGPRERRRHGALLRDTAAWEALAQLAPGDFLVHAEHGIGVYRGLVLLELGGVRGEFLRLEYEGGDRLFLPVHRLNLVQRYEGADGAPPRVDKLGGVTWERTRRAVRKSVRSLARQLLAVHAERELTPGFAYSPRDRAFEEFEAAFPYEETPDQASAIEDVLADLERPRPMDRLVCGDVGYGKTEVAARAAFRVMMDGRQVAVLVPTTVLCQQHDETFRKRFEPHPVRIESLSRFRSPKEVRQVLEGLAGGAVDLVVGTHRLLGKDVAFRDLGLLVVDEEHRFGVAHKERIKQLKKTVDVLTLTATPIPRTLQMAFAGLRDLSVIETPPPDRLAVRTLVCRFEENLIREAILREVRRGGQVFFVHNRVQSIDAFGELLGRVVPEVRLIVAHGQMREHELEDRMLAFLRREADVLLCTTIIESGLDISSANTMLIDRADRLGLAQLYQLRGRVGRSSHRAYAYLMVPGEDAITEQARRRLEAMQDLAELGSGFRLANMDLEIRGAGNLLGPEQSGNLEAVGYDAYMDLLAEAIDELRGQVRETAVDPEIKVPVPARLPEEYVPEVSQRLVLYKRLAGAPDVAELERVRSELLDRYGPLPPDAEDLVRVIRVKIAARQAGVVSVEWSRGDLVMAAGAGSHIDPRRLVEHLQDPGSGVQLDPDQRIRLRGAGGAGPAALLEAAARLLSELRGGEAQLDDPAAK